MTHDNKPTCYAMSTVGHLSPGLYPPSYPCRHPCAVCCQHGSLPPALPLSLVVSASPFHSRVSITDVFRASQVLSSLQDPPSTLPTLLARVLHSPHRQAFVSSCSNRLLPWSSRSASLLHEPSPALPRCALPSRTCSAVQNVLASTWSPCALPCAAWHHPDCWS